MDFLKSHKRRSRVSEAAYIGLNIGLAAALFIVVAFGLSIWLAVAAVLLSKWRALAVRPRFWVANLIANTVDIIVGLSTVVLMYNVNSAWLQLAFAMLYAGWLLYIKPRSRRSFVAAQACIAIFLGITALSVVSVSWDVFFFVLVMWVIGYVTTRHILGSYDEPLTHMYNLVGGVMFAEMGWIGYHWLIAYPIVGFGNVKFSQLALFTLLMFFIFERSYRSYHRHGEVRRNDITLPILLAISISIALYILAVVNGNNAL